MIECVIGWREQVVVVLIEETIANKLCGNGLQPTRDLILKASWFGLKGEILLYIIFSLSPSCVRFSVLLRHFPIIPDPCLSPYPVYYYCQPHSLFVSAIRPHELFYLLSFNRTDIPDSRTMCLLYILSLL